jgi:hypothetical protein
MRARMMMVVVTGVLMMGPAPAEAAGLGSVPIDLSGLPATPAKPLDLTFTLEPPVVALGASTRVGQSPAPAPAFEYSDGYRKRATIHKWSSWAMLPLFGVEAYLGQKMFNDVNFATDGHRAVHRSVAWGIGGLFALNTATGIPNLIESRRDPNKSDLALAHGVLMLVADAGFLATALTRPSHTSPSGLEIYTPKKNQHLTIAYASISVASVSWLLMLFGK